MKKVFYLFLTLSMLLALTFTTACAEEETTTQTSQEPVKLVIATFLPEQDLSAQYLKVLGDRIIERSTSEVTIEYAWAGVLGGPGDLYDLCIQGVCDIAYFQPGSVTGMFPVTDAMGLPWAFETAEVSFKMLKALWDEGYFDEEYAGVKMIYMIAGGTEAIFTTDTPLVNISDTEGLKIRVPGVTQGDRVEAMGMTPVNMPMTEMYMAAEKGTVDGAITGWMAVPALKLYEVFNYASFPEVAALASAVVMNEDSYDKLPADVREVIDDLSADWEVGWELSQEWTRLTPEYQQMFVDNGGQLTEWDAEAINTLNVNLETLWSKWMDYAKTKGVDTTGVLDTMYHAAQGEGIDNPAIGYSPD